MKRSDPKGHESSRLDACTRIAVIVGVRAALEFLFHCADHQPLVMISSEAEMATLTGEPDRHRARSTTILCIHSPALAIAFASSVCGFCLVALIHALPRGAPRGRSAARLVYSIPFVVSISSDRAVRINTIPLIVIGSDLRTCLNGISTRPARPCAACDTKTARILRLSPARSVL